MEAEVTTNKAAIFVETGTTNVLACMGGEL
jgi:hypothetical protein